MTCPLCQHDAEPTAFVRDVAICAGCGASVNSATGKAATLRDIETLTASEITLLRHQRQAVKASL